MGLTVGHLFLGECLGIKPSSFKLGLFKLGLCVGTLLGLEDVGDRVGSFDGGRVMGLTASHSFLEESVGIKLGWIVVTLLGLEDVGIRASSFVGSGVMGLTVCPPEAVPVLNKSWSGENFKTGLFSSRSRRESSYFFLLPSANTKPNTFVSHFNRIDWINR